MQKFNAHLYYVIGHALGALIRFYRAPGQEGRPLEKSEVMLQSLATIRDRCNDANLRVSETLVANLIPRVQNLGKQGESQISVAEFASALDHISATIRIEMTQALFMYIPEERASFYNKPELFGEAVNANSRVSSLMS